MNLADVVVRQAEWKRMKEVDSAEREDVQEDGMPRGHGRMVSEEEEEK